MKRINSYKPNKSYARELKEEEEKRKNRVDNDEI